MKYKAGDKIVIKKDLTGGYLYGIPIRQYMKFAGREAIIRRVNEYDNNYNIDIDGGAWVWAPFQIEDAISDKCYDCKCFNTCNKRKCILDE